jgi:radical SAM protein with 4Fe4S-binding SPASM domain
MTAQRMPARRLTVLPDDHYPAYVVWELTLRCDQACAHCGSRAGRAREDELTTAEALDMVKQLAAMRTQEVVLIGGEAYLHDGFLDVIRALKQAGIRPTMTTGGRSLTAEMAVAMKQAGLFSVSVSVDGLRTEHNLMRQSDRSFDAAMSALHHVKAAGLKAMANTNFNRLNAPTLESLYELLRDAGVQSWQVQITVPLGRGADRPQLLFQPYDLVDFVPRVAALKQRAFGEGVLVMPGNNLGYFGPEEGVMRSPFDTVAAGHADHWQGCQAGKLVMGIESHGAIKGCPSLQPSYIGGNIRDQSLSSLWQDTAELGFNRARSVDDLWGFCKTCPFASVCLGGCTFTAHAVLGRPGNNPYCHFRARSLAKDGLRERLVAADAAPGLPFDNGLFVIVTEPLSAPEPVATTPPVGAQLVRISRPSNAANDQAG